MRIMNTTTYKTVGDYMLPNIAVPTKEHHIGKYGTMRRTYLKQHRPTLYSTLLMTGKLLEHLEETDKVATQQVNSVISQMAKSEGITEQLKVENPIKWAGLVNNIQHCVEEAVLQDLIYS